MQRNPIRTIGRNDLLVKKIIYQSIFYSFDNTMYIVIIIQCND